MEPNPRPNLAQALGLGPQTFDDKLAEVKRLGLLDQYLPPSLAERAAAVRALSPSIDTARFNSLIENAIRDAMRELQIPQRDTTALRDQFAAYLAGVEQRRQDISDSLLAEIADEEARLSEERAEFYRRMHTGIQAARDCLARMIREEFEVLPTAVREACLTLLSYVDEMNEAAAPGAHPDQPGPSPAPIPEAGQQIEEDRPDGPVQAP